MLLKRLANCQNVSLSEEIAPQGDSVRTEPPKLPIHHELRTLGYNLTGVEFRR